MKRKRNILQISKLPIALFIAMMTVMGVQGQVRKAFTPRMSTENAGNQGIYNLRGDFTMIGNTNMSRTNDLGSSYDNDNNNSNATMNYVKVDPAMVNSSRAELKFYEGGDVKANCSEIIYAGLYWTGRAHNSSSSNDEFTVNLGSFLFPDNRTLNKRKVKIKGPGASSYTEITANTNDIWYPSGSDDNMYAGYADITHYVKQYGTGDYTVADIALREGNGGSVGYFGGWSMVVVYGNAKMSWKDIVVFDGYAYLDGPSKKQFELPVSGFHAVQGEVPVNVKIGLMAGEGDRGIPNDYFQMKRQDNNNFVSLSHSGNSTTNFFNSSIVTGGNNRYPNYVNNTGLDIAMFDLNNGDKRYITNEQTSTTFRYGSDQDTYIIPLIVIGIDSYVPEVEAFNEIVSIDGNTSNTTVAQPGETVKYKIEIRNRGDESVKDVKIEIPVPFTGSYVSASATYRNDVTGNKTVTKEGGNPGKIVWDIGNLPKPANKDDILATLEYEIKVTTNCAILSNSNCVMFAVNGSTSAVGAVTGIPYHSNRFVSGFNIGECEDIPLYEPFNVEIDTEAYFNDPDNECEQGSGEDVLVFTFCDVGDEGISAQDLLSSFPAGTKFYTDKEHYANPDDEADTQEYVRGVGEEIGTDTNPFPTDVTTNQNHGPYYAIPPGFLVTCFWTIELQIDEFCGNFWVGTENNDWSDSDNWTINVPAAHEDVVFATHDNNKGKPALKDLHLDDDYIINDLINDSDKDLVITTGNQLTIEGKVIDNNPSAGTIIIESAPDEPTGTLIFTNTSANANVDATVQFYNKAYTCIDCGPDRQQWQYFGIPVKTASSMPFSAGISGTVNKWDEKAFGNKWVAPGSPLTAFAGYEINDGATSTPSAIYNFSGKLNVGNANVTITKTTDVNYSGRNLIGNSYTAAIPIKDGFTFDNSKWNQTVYLFNTGSRNEWRKLSGSTVNGVEGGRYVSVPINNAGQGGLPIQIPSMHAFMIDATDGGTLSIDYSKLTKNALIGTGVAWRSASTKPTAMPYIVMEVVGSQSADKVWMFENITATRSMQAGWDGVKMSEGGITELYVKGDDDNKFQVATVPQLQGTTLGIKPDNNENFTISFAVSPEVESRNLHLRDLVTGRAYAIRNGVEYNIAGIATENENRFRIISLAAGEETKQWASETIINVFVVDHSVGVVNNSDENCIATLYDFTGKVISKQPVERATTSLLNGNGKLQGGVYMVKVNGKTVNETKRVLVR